MDGQMTRPCADNFIVGEAPTNLHLKICDFDGPPDGGQHIYVSEGISHDDGNS